jgi:hypothetical protein
LTTFWTRACSPSQFSGAMLELMSWVRLLLL